MNYVDDLREIIQKLHGATATHIPPVVSPLTAVRAAIMQGIEPMQQKPRKVGRPKKAKGEAKGKIVPVRFNAEALKKVTTAAKAKNQTISEWVRSTLYASLEG